MTRSSRRTSYGKPGKGSVGTHFTVDSGLSVEKGHAIAKEYRHELLHHLKYLSDATIHVDPATESGSDYHHVAEHSHEGQEPHSH